MNNPFEEIFKQLENIESYSHAVTTEKTSYCVLFIEYQLFIRCAVRSKIKP